jgi:phenylacetate-CoA ligase
MINWRKPVIFALLYLTGSKIPKYLKEIKKIDKFSLEEKEQYQKDKLEKILLHAWKNVPYYTKVLTKTGVVKDNKVNLKNFHKIPILTKEIIRKEGKNLYSKDYQKRGFYKNTSGGSTGEPISLIQDRHYSEWNTATKLYFFNDMFNKAIGEPEVNLWGSENDIYKNSKNIKDKIINFLYHRTFLNSFLVEEETLDQFVHIINNIRPVSFWTYVESLDLLAKHIKKNNLKIHFPKFIISTAGNLHSEIRKNAEIIFHCPVYNQYGSREVGAIGIECQTKSGMHEFFWMNYLEVIDNNIIVTSLNNYSMPLIRYEIGDTGIKAKNCKCKCGRETLFFEKVLGRSISHFKTPKGEVIHGQYFIHQFYFRDWIKKFRLVQEDYDLITCYIVLEDNPLKKDMDEIEQRIKLLMGKKCRIQWKFVKKINPFKNGKYLYTISKLN